MRGSELLYRMWAAQASTERRRAPHIFQSTYPLPHNSHSLTSSFYCMAVSYINTQAAVQTTWVSSAWVQHFSLETKYFLDWRMNVSPKQRRVTTYSVKRSFQTHRMCFWWRWSQSVLNSILKKDKNSKLTLLCILRCFFFCITSWPI